MFGKLYVAPVVHEFLAAYPDVTVRLVLADIVVDLVENHNDAAVRIGELPDSSLVARRVGTLRWVVCASPDYLARRGTPQAPDELTAHECVALEGLQQYRTWLFESEPRDQSIAIRPRFSVNTADAVIDGAVAGLGVAQVMSYQAANAVGAGRLVPILEASAPAPIPVHLIHASQEWQPLKQRAFLDFVAPRLKLALERIDKSVNRSESV